MAASGKRISKTIVDAAKPGERDQFIRDPELKGFGLKVTPGGTKTYFLEWRMGGRNTRKGRHTIGRHGSPWTPDTARNEAKRVLGLVKNGVDPTAERTERHREAVELAFDDYADLFVERYAKRNQPRSWAATKRALHRDAKPVLHNRPLPQITRSEIVQLVERLSDRSPGEARAAHKALRKLFRWAVQRGDIDRSPIADMEPPSPSASRDRVLSDVELAEVWYAACGLEAPFGPIVRLLVTTGQRRNEVAAMRWSEVDFSNATWTIPAERAKNAKVHIVPLNALAMSALEEMRPQADKTVKADSLIFTTTGKTPPSGWSRAKQRIDAAILAKREQAAAEMEADIDSVTAPARWTLHDLRRTLATGLQRLGVRFEVTEAVLNHISGSRSGVAGIYQRHSWADEKRAALDAWGAHVERLIGSEAPPSNIIPIAVERAA